VVESPTQFVCERLLKQEELSKHGAAPRSCGFVFPRTVCKREITREEAEVYLRTGKTGLLTEFTSRFGRPFSATLVLKKNGRHGFEFQPREGGAARGRKKTTQRVATADETAEAAAAPARPRRRGARKAAAPAASVGKAKPARPRARRKRTPADV
jgi:DNA topoisomerase-3